MGLLVRPSPAFQRRNRQQERVRLEAGGGPLPGGLSVFGCENIFKTMPPTCLWTPRSKPLVFTKTNLLPGSGSFGAHSSGAGALLSVSPSFLWAHPSFPQPASSSGRSSSASPMELPVLLQAASGGHQDRCEG